MSKILNTRLKRASTFFLLVVGVLLLLLFLRGDTLQKLPDSTGIKNASNQIQTEPFDKSFYSINQASSPWVVINKGRILPAGYTPAGLVTPGVPLRFSPSSQEMKLRNDTVKSLENLFAGAKKENLQLMIVSGYRSYSSQWAIYNRNLKVDGRAVTDATSARPGHSEHQTGLAVDVGAKSRSCELDKCFASTAEGIWIAENGHKYGFVVRYPEGKQNLTGYDFEPWHLRYVGIELASELQLSGQTLEQFFGLPAHSVYSETPSKLN